jgi:transketolase
MRSSRRSGPLVRARAWLVTGPLGRGLAFAVDFGVAFRTMVAQRRRRM